MIMFIVGLICFAAAVFVGFVLVAWTSAYPLSMLAAVLFFPAVWWLAGVWQRSSDRKKQVAMQNHPTFLPTTSSSASSSLDDPLDGLR